MKFCFWQKIKFRYRWHPWHAYLLLAVAPLLVYGKSIFFDYTYLDDQGLILESSEILDRANPAEIFFNDVFFGTAKYYYRPLLTWSFVLDWHWGGGQVFAFHASNLLFHIIAIWLLYLLLQRAGVKRQTAFWLSFFFAIHPALTQAAVWIPGRNDSLLAIFMFSALIFLSRWFRQERLRDLIFLWVFFLLALLTKETAAVLPFLALGWILTFERRDFTWFKLGLSMAGGFVAGVIWFLLRTAALEGTSGHIFSSLFNNLLSPVIFLGKAIFPFNLSVYPVPADTTWIYGIAALLVISVLLFYSRPWRPRRLLFGILWFWPLLVLGSARPDGEMFRNFMEHRLYVPMFGLLIILAETENFWQQLNGKWRRYLLGGMTVLFALLSFRHCGYFADRLAFWESAAASSPHSPLAQRNLGAMYYLENRPDEAEQRYRQALVLNPEEVMVHNNLAVIYIDRQDWWRAENELKKELAINPSYDVALFNLGRVYFEKRRYQDAAALWRETLRINPRHYEAALRLNEVLKLIE